MVTMSAPAQIDDPINARILEVSEDRIPGFHPDPIGFLAQQTELAPELIIERLKTMLEAGTIRRIRQTLMATNLAQGSLVAWQVPQERLNDAFDFLFNEDPFSGHVVIRSTDAETIGSTFRLWTTLKVPQGYSILKHSEYLQQQIGATQFRLMPAKRLFVLGVGHLRRRNISVGSMADVPAEVHDTKIVTLSDLEWKVLVALKREFKPAEIGCNLWEARANEAEVPLDEFAESRKRSMPVA
jgi:hypothetical protein